MVDQPQAQARDRQRPVQPLDPHSLPAQREGKAKGEGSPARRASAWRPTGGQARRRGRSKPGRSKPGEGEPGSGSERGEDHGVVLSRGPS
jgi:hypothetical protein